jgi:hypothetical protein
MAALPGSAPRSVRERTRRREAEDALRQRYRAFQLRALIIGPIGRGRRLRRPPVESRLDRLLGGVVNVLLDHMSVRARDRAESMKFYAEVFGVPADGPRSRSGWLTVSSGLSLIFEEGSVEDRVHCAFRVEPGDFDVLRARLGELRIPLGPTRGTPMARSYDVRIGAAASTLATRTGTASS